MAQGGGSQAATVAAEQASQQPGNSLLQHMNFRGHEAEAVNQEQPEHILGKTFRFYFRPVDFYSFKISFEQKWRKNSFQLKYQMIRYTYGKSDRVQVSMYIALTFVKMLLLFCFAQSLRWK